MSYILEALKKAEAERHGGVAQAVHLPPSFAAHGRNPFMRNRLWLWTLLPAAMAAAGTAAWITRAPAVQPSVPAPPQVAAIEEVPAPVKLQEAPVPAKPKEKPARKPPERKRPVEREQTRTAKASGTEASVGTMRDLPDQIQREIPPLAVGGYIYAGNKVDRSVLINKRLLHEGEEVAPGLTLEQMLPNGMILNYKGYRYRSSY